MRKIEQGTVAVSLDEKSLMVTLEQEKTKWSWKEGFRPYMECEEGELFFDEAASISHETYQTGIGVGIRSIFSDFEKEGKKYPYSFETLIWIEGATGHVYFEWIPLKEEGLHIKKLFWPGAMEFTNPSKEWYTLLTHEQGVLIPNDWETELGAIPFNGFFETAGGYMPWFGQVKEREGYIAICETPWNGGYYANHPANGPYTHVGVYFEPSLGKMDYRRIMRYTFASDCDYNTLCKIYRGYVNEQGRLRTLSEKAMRNPSINDLIGCAFVHKGIKTQVQENSDFFDPENPDKNNHLTTFETRVQEIKEIHEPE